MRTIELYRNGGFREVSKGMMDFILYRLRIPTLKRWLKFKTEHLKNDEFWQDVSQRCIDAVDDGYTYDAAVERWKNICTDTATG